MFNKKYINKIKELKEINAGLVFENDTLKDAREERLRKSEEQKYREALLEQEKLELNNVISNLMEEVNRLNAEIIKLKKVKKDAKVNK